MATFLRVWTITVSVLSLLLFADEEERLNTFTAPTTEERLLEFKEAFERIDSAMKSGDFDTVARLLALALQHSSDAPETALTQHGALLLPVSEAVSKRLPRLTEDALELFKTLTEPQAKRAFMRAKDRKMLLSLIGRYPLSDAASHAAELLLDTSLERGDGLTALIAVSFLEKKGGESPILRLKTAVANSLVGNGSSLANALDELSITPEKRKLLSNFILLRNRSSQATPSLNTYPYAILNLAQDECETILGSSSIKWRKDIPVSSKQTVYPLLLGGKIYIASLSSLTIIEASSGRTLSTRRFARSDPYGEEKYCPIPGVLATNGEYIYGSFWSEKAGSPHLYALTSEGRTVWSTDETYDPFLNSVYVCGAPVLHDSTVFVTVTLQRGNDAALYLLAFSTDGDFLWRTHIGTAMRVRTTHRALRGIRIRSKPEPVPPVTLSVDEHTVFFCTNSGALGAVDSSSGALEWILLYPLYREKRKETITFYEGDEAPLVFNPPLLIRTEYKGKRHEVVVAAPADTDRIVGVNIQRKTAFWVNRYRRAFILPFGGNLVATESGEEEKRITLLHPPTAKVLWRSNLNELPIAPPIALKDAFILPFREKVLLFEYDASQKNLKRKTEIRMPELRKERIEGRFHRRKTPSLYASGTILNTNESIITFNPSGVLASLKEE